MQPLATQADSFSGHVMEEYLVQSCSSAVAFFHENGRCHQEEAATHLNDSAGIFAERLHFTPFFRLPSRSVGHGRLSSLAGMLRAL